MNTNTSPRQPDTARPSKSPVDPRGNSTGDPTFQVVGMIDNGGCWDSDAGEQAAFIEPTFGS